MTHLAENLPNSKEYDFDYYAELQDIFQLTIEMAGEDYDIFVSSKTDRFYFGKKIVRGYCVYRGIFEVLNLTDIANALSEATEIISKSGLNIGQTAQLILMSNEV